MPGKSKKGGGLESSPIYRKQKFGEAKSPFMMKGSPYKKVTTKLNKDGSITKTDTKTGKSSTYTVDPKNKKRYSNPTGGEFFIK